MANKPITYKSKPIAVNKATVRPEFNSKTVLVADNWDYVNMWLKRNKKSQKAQFYWNQSKQFYEASKLLPKTSSPLTSYYCFLNAVKCLLISKNRATPDRHGITGGSEAGPSSLSNEYVVFKSNGILSQLCEYLGEISNNEKYSLKDLLYNLPYIHRSFDLTYSSTPELFTPIYNPQFVKKIGSTEAWFQAEVREKRYANQHLIKKLPGGYEQDAGALDKFIIRKRKRFRWVHGGANERANIRRLTRYHRKVRKHLYYIHGPTKLWYIKRNNEVNGVIDRSSTTLTFAAMHRLSEMSRYDPVALSKHFECNHNWLLTEFILTAPSQFIDELSAEITGQEFMIPGRKTVT